MKSRKYLFAVFIILLAVAAGCFYYIKNQDKKDDGPPMAPEMNSQADMITAVGTTSTGVIEVEMDFDFLDADLIVEEIYVSSSDQVEAGARVLKITDSSLKEAVRELERAKMDASLAYRQGLMDYETGRLDAENVLKKTQIDTDFAQTVYDNTIALAEVDVQKAQQEVEDAQKIVDEYTDSIENDYYYTEYEVEEKKEAYEKNVALFLRNWMIMDMNWMMTMTMIPIPLIL